MLYVVLFSISANSTEKIPLQTNTGIVPIGIIHIAPLQNFKKH